MHLYIIKKNENWKSAIIVSVVSAYFCQEALSFALSFVSQIDQSKR